ncbi:MAG: neutral/alkaline ceramidase [Desulfobacteraceae bacterium]|nr:neutral/alkaline ceramidase [Desulfobacteraceae bacterium]
MPQKKKTLLPVLLFIALILLPAAALAQDYSYRIGRGKSDITGPAAQVGMLGYAKFDQKTQGIHSRQWARAFVISDLSGEKRVAFATIDAVMMFHGIKKEIIAQLQSRFGDIYTYENVLISATHTHSGPGGYSHYALYNVTSLGHVRQTFDAIVSGTVDAIEKAHEDLKPGNLFINKAVLENAGVNRSLEAYLKNKDAGDYPDNIDKQMTVLRFTTAGKDIGAVSWFAVHCVSMTNQNTFISGDNKGRASFLFENKKGADFVAAFAQTNSGDVSPNLNGDGTGPTDDEVVNTNYIGTRQFEKAFSLFDAATQRISGQIDYRHSFVDFHNITLSDQFNDGVSAAKTCRGALGYSFGAGTEDGLGWENLFEEGQLKDNPFIKALGWMLLGADEQMKQCQKPKPILLATGNASPYPWTPAVLPLQLIKIGKLLLVGLPAEITTMAGRRLRNQVHSLFADRVDHVIIASYSNHYSGYVTTPEEYDVQHYEGGSTLYGRWTLNAYMQEFSRIAKDMINGQASSCNGEPVDLSTEQLCFQTGVVYDGVPLFKNFGDVQVQPDTQYRAGDTVRVTFWTGHPKNNLKAGKTFLQVQLLSQDGWQTVATDNDWETFYYWQRANSISGTSKAVITWHIPLTAKPGTYRICHYGDRKNLLGKITPFSGISDTFKVFRENSR